MADRVASGIGKHGRTAGRNAGCPAGARCGVCRLADAAGPRLADGGRTGWRDRPTAGLGRSRCRSPRAGSGRCAYDVDDRAGARWDADSAGAWALGQRVAHRRARRPPRCAAGDAASAANAVAPLAALSSRCGPYRSARTTGRHSAGTGDGRAAAGRGSHHASRPATAAAATGEPSTAGGRLAFSATVTAEAGAGSRSVRA